MFLFSRNQKAIAFAVFLILLVLSMLGLIGCATSPAPHGVPNFAQVQPGVWRGGQPTQAGWDYLKSLGVERVVKLNEPSEGDDGYARAVGLQVADVPVSLPQQLGLEPMPALWEWDGDAGFPLTNVFIHCEHGQDRTGMFVALLRVYEDGWSKADAEKEMLAHGFHKSLVGLWRYWERQ